jgi:NADH:ubiquinone oxidoreductase subunit 6 (subunit J)
VVSGSVLILTFGASALGVLLLTIAAVAVIAALAAGLMFLRGSAPAPVAGWWHAWREAGYRVGGVWAEFRDWLR